MVVKVLPRLTSSCTIGYGTQIKEWGVSTWGPWGTHTALRCNYLAWTMRKMGTEPPSLCKFGIPEGHQKGNYTDIPGYIKFFSEVLLLIVSWGFCFVVWFGLGLGFLLETVIATVVERRNLAFVGGTNTCQVFNAAIVCWPPEVPILWQRTDLSQAFCIHEDSKCVCC